MRRCAVVSTRGNVLRSGLCQREPQHYVDRSQDLARGADPGPRWGKIGLGIRFILFVSAIAFFGQLTASAATITAASCASSDVQSAVNSALSGDTVVVPAGSCTWSTAVSIPSTKGLTLTCPSGSCIITGSMGVNTGKTSTGDVITGFSFTSGMFTVRLASGPPYNTTPRVYNNTFTGSGTQIEVDGLGPALFDHNTVNSQSNADETVHLLGGSAGCTSCWTEDVVPGSADMVFFEDNTWNGPSGGYCQVEESNYGAVYVLRHNTFNSCQIDAHGGPPSARWLEVYNNTYNNCCTSSSDFDWRGASGVYFNNTTVNRSGSTDTALGPICGSSDICGTYPVQYQFGMGIGGLNYSPVYVWGSDYSSTSAHVKSGATGMVQMGTAPTDPANCSGLSGNLCNAVKTTTQPATLVRCESAADVAAGCPVSYSYTPYTYPHPLQGGSASAPAPPSGLTAVVQ